MSNETVSAVIEDSCNQIMVSLVSLQKKFSKLTLQPFRNSDVDAQASFKVDGVKLSGYFYDDRKVFYSAYEIDGVKLCVLSSSNPDIYDVSYFDTKINKRITISFVSFNVLSAMKIEENNEKVFCAFCDSEKILEVKHFFLSVFHELVRRTSDAKKVA